MVKKFILILQSVQLLSAPRTGLAADMRYWLTCEILLILQSKISS